VTIDLARHVRAFFVFGSPEDRRSRLNRHLFRRGLADETIFRCAATFP
jgi:hypothetical protein